MAKLTAKTRKAIPTSKFAGPNRTYPDQDRSHAINAKERVANKSPALKARVDAKVSRDWPSLGKNKTGGGGFQHHGRNVAKTGDGKKSPWVSGQ